MRQNNPAAPHEQLVTKDSDWRRLFAGGRPREVLARIVQGDPLGVRRTVARRLRERVFLADADRVHLRALARIARFSGRYTGRPPLDVWLAGEVDAAIDDRLREEQDATEDARETAHEGSSFSALAGPLGLDPGSARAACAAFNRATQEDRRAFLGLVIDADPLDDLARRLGSSAPDVARRARRVLLDVLAATARRST